MNPTPNGNLNLSTYSASPSSGTTVIMNNGPATSPSPGMMASASSPIISRPMQQSGNQPEQIIVPVGNMISRQSDSSSRQILATSQATSMSSTQSSASSSATASSDQRGVLDRSRLRDLVKEVDPLEQMDDDVEEVLLQVADDFIENVVASSCQLAKHRKSNTLEAKDVQLYLERCWNMQIPGFGGEEPTRPYKKSLATEAHKQRMALIRKTLKKY